MASRASKIAVEDSITEFNKTRHRNSGTTGSESENANGKPKPAAKKKPKKAKSVYARSVMTTMTNKVSVGKIIQLTAVLIPPGSLQMRYDQSPLIKQFYFI